MLILCHSSKYSSGYGYHYTPKERHILIMFNNEQ